MLYYLWYRPGLDAHKYPKCTGGESLARERPNASLLYDLQKLWNNLTVRKRATFISQFAKSHLFASQLTNSNGFSY